MQYFCGIHTYMYMYMYMYGNVENFSVHITEIGLPKSL